MEAQQGLLLRKHAFWSRWFPISDDPEVKIIGGGMAGLMCALNLEKRGICSTVFDTENIPKVTAERVTTQMLQGVELALGLPEGSLKKSSYTKVQIW